MTFYVLFSGKDYISSVFAPIAFSMKNTRGYFFIIFAKDHIYWIYGLLLKNIRYSLLRRISPPSLK